MCGCWQWQGFARPRGFGRRFRFSHWGGPWYPTREDELRSWEEYQKDLEEELADVTTRIERLKKSQQKESPSAA